MKLLEEQNVWESKELQHIHEGALRKQWKNEQ